MKLIVFEGVHETLVGDAAKVNKLVEDWFLNGERNLDEFDVYFTDGGNGVLVTSKTVANMADEERDAEIIELMPNVLREALIKKGLLTDE